MTHTIVFLGPSLSLLEAKKILPDAYFHAPVKCGDVIKVMRLNPKRIAIIDGFFEQTASVWHKEILYAISQGVEVFGASSMGALRAAELYQLGMQGIGKIFELYRDGITADDDEVALVHDAANSSKITPLINVRFSLEIAIEEKQLTPTEAAKIFLSLKQLPYYNRSLLEITQEEPKLHKWAKEHYIDQKQLDAIELLQYLSNTEYQKPNPIEEPSGLFFNKIYREMINRPFEHDYDWLPQSEKKMLRTRKNDSYSYLMRLKKLEHVVKDIESKTDIILTKPIASHKLMTKYFLLYQNELSKYLDKNDQFYINDFRKKHSKKAKVIDGSISNLNKIISYMKQLELNINEPFIQEFAQFYRRTLQLYSKEQLFAWLDKNHLKPKQFERFIRTMIYLRYFIDKNNIGLLGIETSKARSSRHNI